MNSKSGLKHKQKANKLRKGRAGWPIQTGSPATGLHRWGVEAICWLEWENQISRPQFCFIKASKGRPVEAWGFSPTKQIAAKRPLGVGSCSRRGTASQLAEK